MIELSIIIPVGQGDSTWGDLLESLTPVTTNVEILLVASNRVTNLERIQLEQAGVKVIYSREGRAYQMNEGARQALGRYLWFLHADSQFRNPNPIEFIMNVIKEQPVDTLYYCKLAFLGGHSRHMLNALGANLRSRFLGLPFGDQGFLLSSEQFISVGGYDEQAEYGEDHLFAWKHHHLGLAIKSIPLTIWTSPRKYLANGWISTSWDHVRLTVVQALPEFVRLVRKFL